MGRVLQKLGIKRSQKWIPSLGIIVLLITALAFLIAIVNLWFIHITAVESAGYNIYNLIASLESLATSSALLLVAYWAIKNIHSNEKKIKTLIEKINTIEKEAISKEIGVET